MRRNSRGRRYQTESKLNVKKVIGVILAIAVIIMIIYAIINIIKNNSNTGEKITQTQYFSVYSNNKWGVIDNLGNTVITPNYNEMVTIPNSKEAVFLITYDINDEEGTYKIKAIDNNSKQLFIQYELIEAIDNYDSSLNIWYEKNILKVKKDGKYGLIDLKGNEVLACKYSNIYSLKGVENSIITEEDGKLGLVSGTAQSIIENKYKDIQKVGDDYTNGYIVVDENSKYGLIGINKSIILETKYDGIKYLSSNEKYAVKEGENWKVINKDNASIILESGYDELVEVSAENVVIKKDNKYGIINISGEEKIAPIYEEIKHAFSDYFIAKKDNKYGMININNVIKLDFKYSSIVYRENAGFIEAEDENFKTIVFDQNLTEKFSGIISEVNEEKGYIKAYINDEVKYYNFKFEEKSSVDLLSLNNLYLSKKDGKYGFVNRIGEVVVNYNYDFATEQNEYGFAAVKKNGLWGCINIIGQETLTPSVNLDDSIFTSFIGKWHLSDNGMFYEE